MKENLLTMRKWNSWELRISNKFDAMKKKKRENAVNQK